MYVCMCTYIQTVRPVNTYTNFTTVTGVQQQAPAAAADQRKETNTMTDFFDNYIHSSHTRIHTKRVEARKQTNKQIIQSLQANGKTL